MSSVSSGFVPELKSTWRGKKKKSIDEINNIWSLSIPLGSLGCLLNATEFVAEARFYEPDLSCALGLWNIENLLNCHEESTAVPSGSAQEVTFVGLSGQCANHRILPPR